MKKFFFCLTVAVFLIIVCLFITVGYNQGNETNARVADDCLFSDNGYINYASKVFLDTEKYTDMEEMGLFWTKWDDENQCTIKVPADTCEGAALVDTSKPTLINVHGMLTDGHIKQQCYDLNSEIADPEEFGLDTDNVSMIYLWLKNGWNVGNYYYNRFAAEDLPYLIENKIWSTDKGIRYRHSDGSYENNVSDYTLAEHFCAEYIRAMKFLPSSMGDKEIRLAAHSMGGQLSTAGLFLLNELSKNGQIDKKQLPDRYTMLDPYFSGTLQVGEKEFYMGPSDININWSGKPIYKNNVGKMMIECLKQIENDGIVLEYYTYPTSFLKLAMKGIVEDLRELCTYCVIYPNWNTDNGYTILENGHNAVREWYMCSIMADTVDDITFGNNTTEKAPSASMLTTEIKRLKGKQYTLIGGETSVNASDDKMIRTYAIYYDLQGGINAKNNINDFSKKNNIIKLLDAKKDGYIFDGWYETSDFIGEKIIEIDPNRKKDIKLFAKWIKE